MKTGIAIVGAGIAGLSAAWELTQTGHSDFVVLEAGARAGGTVASRTEAGFVMEQGPDSFLTQKAAGMELCEEVGLAPALMGTLPNPGGARIWHRGRLCPLPAGWRMVEPTRLLPLLRSPLLAWGAKLALLANWPAGPDAGVAQDESVAAYLRRRYGARGGDALAAALAGPMLAGVFGGDIEALSRAAVAPPPTAATIRSGTMFTSLRGGMESLVTALVAQLPAGALRLRSEVGTITARPRGGWVLGLADGEALAAEAVIVATPVWRAATLLADSDAGLGAALGAIPCASSINVNFGYIKAPALPAGHGFLVPRRAGKRLLACTLAHQKFAGRAPAGGALLRLFFDGEVACLRDAEVEALARRELREILGVDEAPDVVRIARAPQAMPQYTVGHAARREIIAQSLARHAGLFLAGNGYAGVGIPDCIASGRGAAQAALTRTAAWSRAMR